MAFGTEYQKKAAIPHSLTEQHLIFFGAIIQWFARHELLMQDIMATVAGSDTAAIMLLTRGLDFEGKRQALFDLLRHRAVPLNQFDQIYEYLTPLHTLTSLRNDIAHSAWISSQSSNSIQPDWILRPPPSIEPLRNEPDIPEANIIERDYDQIAYTLDDLREIVERLALNHRRFSKYLHEVGLITQKQMDDQRRQPS